MSAIKKLTKLENGNYQILVELNLVSYNSSQWKKAIDYVNQTLQSGNLMMCEFGAKSLQQHLSGGIDLRKVSHKITKCFEVDDTIQIELETLPTPLGIDLCKMIELEPDKVKFNWAAQGEGTEVTQLFQIYAEIA